MHFLGPLYGSERFHYLREAHIFCLPSFHPYGEGQPLSILEAYAAGCLVITTDIGGIPDIFKDGANGFFVQRRSVEDLRRTIREILNSPRKELLKIALYNAEYAKREFTKKRFEKDIKACFEKVIQE